VNVCLDAPLSGTHTFAADTNIDTNPITATPMCTTLQAGSTDVCVIAADAITVNAGRTLSASGSRPLVLIANTITVDGTIDVASHVRGRQGPASDLTGCNNGTNANTTQGGGGQGGSFGGKGGDGGNEDGASASRGLAGNALTNVTTLRGGCPGGHGGRTSFSLGHGGGALLLVADSITISSTGVVNASGAGAEHGIPNDQGGGGGGAGGMIALAATAISLDPSGAIFANGGHGGGGAGNSTSGGDGGDPTAPSSGGTGGAGGDAGGDGAAGYPNATRNGGNGTNNSDGGGGGGGGAGIIHVYSSTALTGTNVSPAPT
ncbi:MAG TPA: hypothetical protein VLB44_05010, partial [Kofleriaceae bacterium]|nr:hypothetical protein [Kofleriaceae bacterium]